MKNYMCIYIYSCTYIFLFDPKHLGLKAAQVLLKEMNYFLFLRKMSDL